MCVRQKSCFFKLMLSLSIFLSVFHRKCDFNINTVLLSNLHYISFIKINLEISTTCTLFTMASCEIVALNFSSIQFSSVTQSYLTLCNPMDESMPGFPVCYQLPEHAQTHVHQVSDAIQPSHPLSSPSPPTFNLSQHQGLFK